MKEYNKEFKKELLTRKLKDLNMKKQLLEFDIQRLTEIVNNEVELLIYYPNKEDLKKYFNEL